jgi:hypothetical protein
VRPPTEIRSFKFLVLFLVVFPICHVYGQETVFDVPSADVLDKGKVYGELDGTVRPVDPLATFTPRLVIGVGHRMEVGMNFDGLSAPALEQLEISPTVKWELWKGKTSGWSFYVGDDMFFSVRRRTYNAGNYVYAFFAKEWKHGTRIGLGGYDFTRQVVSRTPIVPASSRAVGGSAGLVAGDLSLVYAGRERVAR